jgi:hypothetical protein
MNINWYKRAIDHLLWLAEYNVPPLKNMNPSEIILFRNLLEILGEEKFNSLMDATIDTGDFEAFHKCFRQIDIFGENRPNGEGAKLDVMMWHFIHISKIPQYIYYYVQDKNFNGEQNDKDFSNFDW